MKKVPRRIDEVTAGFYRFRHVRSGPWLPAQVTIEDGMIYVVEADERLKIGITADSYADLVVRLVTEGDAFNNNLVRVVWFGEPIEEAEYRHMLDTIAWARQHQPDHPILRPDEPIAMGTTKVSHIF
jgi:hypothetical protein